MLDKTNEWDEQTWLLCKVNVIMSRAVRSIFIRSLYKSFKTAADQIFILFYLFIANWRGTFNISHRTGNSSNFCLFMFHCGRLLSQLRLLLLLLPCVFAIISFCLFVKQRTSPSPLPLLLQRLADKSEERRDGREWEGNKRGISEWWDAHMLGEECEEGWYQQGRGRRGNVRRM